MSVLSICYKRQLNFLVTSADNLVALVFFYLTQVYPLPETDPRLYPPQDAISGLRGANAVGSVIDCHRNPAFVVELFSRENSEVRTTQPGQELETMDEDICRICHDTKEKEELVRVCRCDGSARFAHRSCVLRWFQFSFRQECELCHYKMKIKKNGFKPLKEWSNPCQFMSSVDFFIMLIVNILHGAVFSMIVMVAVTNKCFSLTCISLILLCFASMQILS
ncbi:unnamed protein product [Pocillopora meandrina]|uniref:RING-CH-type domain-containing protein n=1 Tax=Pocillopora meandrina TaxID=46732 RepID=A0AAU9WYX9_9CNID|nr:unnamed protein product [Pocillopora meandrina]